MKSQNSVTGFSISTNEITVRGLGAQNCSPTSLTICETAACAEDSKSFILSSSNTNHLVSAVFIAGQTYSIEIDINRLSAVSVLRIINIRTSNNTLGSFNYTVDGFTIPTLSIEFTPEFGTLRDYIEIVVSDELVQTFHLIPIIVYGPTEAQVPVIGTTIAPQIPHLILHDPPGDGSFSEFQEAKSFCREINNSIDVAAGSSSSLGVKVGVEGSVGFIATTDFEASVEVTAGLNIDTRFSNSSTYEQCINISQGFQTSSLPNAAGVNQDIFIGYGTKIHYGIYGSIAINSCASANPGRPYRNTGLAYYEDPNEITTFVKSEAGILSEIASLQGQVDNTGLSDIVRTRAENQLEVWQQVLNSNNANKQNLGSPINSFQKDGDTGPQLNETEIITTEVTTIETQFALETSVGIEATVEVGGSGVNGTTEFSMSHSKGRSNSQGVEESKLIKYTIDDDDLEDVLFIDVFQDPTYGTPIFKLGAGSKTSCPYEGGIQLDQPVLKLKSSKIDQNPKEHIELFAEYDPNVSVGVFLDRINQSSEEREYQLFVASNDDQAQLDIADLSTHFTLGPDSTDQKFISINRSNAANASNEVFVELRMYPKCSVGEGDIYSVVTIHVTFVDYCDGIGVGSVDVDDDGIPDACDVCPENANHGMHFDGSGEVIEIPSSPSLALTGDFTLEAWINPTDFNGFRGILGKVNGGYWPAPYDYYLLNGNGKPRLFVGAGSGSPIEDIVGNEAPDLNVWTHIAVVKSGNNITHYKNGLANGTGTISVATMDANTSVRIGTRQDGAYKMFGSLDEIRIWNVARTQEEISENMNKEISPTTPGLAAYYQLNEGGPDQDNSSITTVIDLTANNNNGTTNISKLGTSSNWVEGVSLFQLDSNADGLGDLCSAANTDCAQSDLSLGTSSLDAGTYSSLHDLRTGGSIPAGTNVTFLAKSIYLDPNFQIAQTGILTANVGDCSQ